MRTYGGRKLRNAMIRTVEERREQRDAVVMSVDSTNRWAIVKIQGSDEQIRAWFPLNWGTNPSWLKAGNAVRISTPGGNRGRIELVGHGFLLPTAVPGGSSTPTPPAAPDAVLTGLQVTATVPNASMGVAVANGTYRIDEAVYTLQGVPMGNNMEMGSGVSMGGVGAVLSIDADAGQYRYDLIVAGTDGLAHVVKGAGSSSEPTMPSTPADHVLLAWVLLYPNMTAVTNADINRVWTAPVATVLSFTAFPEILHGYSIGNPHFDSTATLTLTVKDQYGNTIGNASPGYYITISFIRGNGDCVCGSTAFDETSGAQTFNSTTGSLTISYTRRGEYTPPYTGNGESSPLFLAEVTLGVAVSALCNVYLYDDNDDPVY